MAEQSIIVIEGAQKGSLLFITNTVKGGTKGNPKGHIGAIEGFSIHMRPSSKWCRQKNTYIQDHEITKRQIIWTQHGGSYSTDTRDDIPPLYLDIPAISYILNKHHTVKSGLLPKSPPIYRLIKFLGQARLSVIKPGFKDGNAAQMDIFREYAKKHETNTILMNRNEHKFFLSDAHLSNLHVCSTKILDAGILHKLLKK